MPKRVLIALARERNFIWNIIVPADGTRAANVGTGDFGTSPIFVQLSDKPLLASILLCGASERKAQRRIEKLRADPFDGGVARSGRNRFIEPKMARIASRLRRCNGAGLQVQLAKSQNVRRRYA